MDTRLPSQLHGYHFWIPFRCFLDTISASRIPFLDTISLLFGYHLSFTDYHLDTIFGYHFRIPFLDTILGYHFPGFTLKRWWLSARFFYPQKFINAWVSCTKLASAHPSIAPAQNIHRTIFWIPFLDTRWYQFWIPLLDTIFGYHLRITWKRRYHLSFTDYQISKFSGYHHFHFCIQNCNPGTSCPKGLLYRGGPRKSCVSSVSGPFWDPENGDTKVKWLTKRIQVRHFGSRIRDPSRPKNNSRIMTFSHVIRWDFPSGDLALH